MCCPTRQPITYRIFVTRHPIAYRIFVTRRGRPPLTSAHAVTLAPPSARKPCLRRLRSARAMQCASATRAVCSHEHLSRGRGWARVRGRSSTRRAVWAGPRALCARACSRSRSHRCAKALSPFSGAHALETCGNATVQHALRGNAALPASLAPNPSLTAATVGSLCVAARTHSGAVQAAANLERTLIARQLLRMRAISARPRPPLRAEQRSVRVFVASNADDTAAECDVLTSRVRPATNSRKIGLRTLGTAAWMYSQVWPALSALGEEYAFAITLVDARIGSSCSSICDSTLQHSPPSIDNRGLG